MKLQQLQEAFGEDTDHAEWVRISACCVAVMCAGDGNVCTTHIELRRPSSEVIQFPVYAPVGKPTGWYSMCTSVTSTLLGELANKGSLIPTIAICVPAAVGSKPELGSNAILCVLICNSPTETFAFSGMAVPGLDGLPEELAQLTELAAGEVAVSISFSMSPYSGPAIAPFRLFFEPEPDRSPFDPCMS